MSSLLLVRHGETEWNEQGLYQGHWDSPLTPRGRKQALEAARSLEGMTGTKRLVTSDSGRAVETARIIGSHLGLEPALDSRLRELDMGALSGKLRSDIVGTPDYRPEPDWRFPGGECFLEMKARVRCCLQELARAGEDVIVVTHAGPIRALLQLVRGVSFAALLSLEVPPDRVTRLGWDDLREAGL